jgi:hypothetical protein
MGSFHRFIHACSSRTVSTESAIGGFVAGAGVGAVLTGWPGIIGGPLVLLTLIIAFVGWAAGMALALPLWWIMHRLGLKCWSAPTLLGALLAPLGTLLVGSWVWQLAAYFSVVGALAGLVLWRVAYRKPAPDAAVFC